MTRDERLITSVNKNEKKAVRMEAAKNEMTMSEFVRVAVLEKINQERETGKSTMTETNDPSAAIASQD